MIVGTVRQFVAAVLNEGKYDSFVATITRDIIEHMKSLSEIEDYDEISDAEMTKIYQWPFAGAHKNRNLTVIFRMEEEYGPEDDIQVEGEYTGGHRPKLLIIVAPTVSDYNANGSPKLLRLLRHIHSNVQRTVAHELEHALQDSFKTGPSDRPEIDPEHAGYDDGDTLGYLTAPHEVAAHVRGFYLQAKRTKKPLGRIIQHVIDQYVAGEFLSDDEAQEVIDTWQAYAKQHFPAGQL